MRNIFRIASLTCLVLATSASADIIPTLTVSSPIAVGNLFQYTYTATLAADQSLNTGNYFTIYDFQGFAGFGTLGSGFSGTTALLGQTPPQVIPFDDPAVLNVTFTYTGPVINPGIGTGSGVSTEIGLFQILSRFNGLGLIDFASQATKNSGFAKGTLVSNVGLTAGPLEGGGTGGTVPEPQVWAMFILGFGAIGVASRRRRPVTISA